MDDAAYSPQLTDFVVNQQIESDGSYATLNGAGSVGTNGSGTVYWFFTPQIFRQSANMRSNARRPVTA